jgi:hypothetical protein
MMEDPYDVHTWSRLYREERLTEARTMQLERKLSRAHKTRPRGRYLLVLSEALSLFGALRQPKAGRERSW